MEEDDVGGKEGMREKVEKGCLESWYVRKDGEGKERD